MYRFLHAADIHLDSPLLKLDRYDGAPVEAFRCATRRAFDNLVELAIREQVRFVLIAGDLYDGDCRDFNTPLYFRRQMEKLRTQAIRVLIIQGNHDAASRMQNAFRLQLPENVHLFPTDRPGTVRLEDLRAAIHGQGFAQREVVDDLSEKYPRPLPGWLNIGLLHTSCGSYSAHDRYAPSSIAGLSAKGYQYWALGHIHQRQDLAGPNPYICYPGNIQGRHIHEAGDKGCLLVTVEEDRVTGVQFRALDVLRWHLCLVDAEKCDDAESVLASVETAIARRLAAADGRSLAVRVQVGGASRAHGELTRHADHWDRRLRELSVDRFDDQVWLEKIKFHTQPERALATHAPHPVLDDLMSEVHDIRSMRAALADVRDDLEKMLRQLPSDPRLGDERIDWDDENGVEALLGEVKELLIGRLAEPGAGV
jgi:DNA repair exonuclease SbcCD nuclease subunit